MSQWPAPTKLTNTTHDQTHSKTAAKTMMWHCNRPFHFLNQYFHCLCQLFTQRLWCKTIPSSIQNLDDQHYQCNRPTCNQTFSCLTICPCITQGPRWPQQTMAHWHWHCSLISCCCSCNDHFCWPVCYTPYPIRSIWHHLPWWSWLHCPLNSSTNWSIHVSTRAKHTCIAPSWYCQHV